jgi:hypothetical protein
VEQRLVDGSRARVLREFEVPLVPISVVHLPMQNVLPAALAFAVMLRRRLAGAL